MRNSEIYWKPKKIKEMHAWRKYWQQTNLENEILMPKNSKGWIKKDLKSFENRIFKNQCFKSNFFKMHAWSIKGWDIEALKKWHIKGSHAWNHLHWLSNVGCQKLEVLKWLLCWCGWFTKWSVKYWSKRTGKTCIHQDTVMVLINNNCIEPVFVERPGESWLIGDAPRWIQEVWET